MGLTQQDYDLVIVKAETDVLVLEGFLPVTHNSKLDRSSISSEAVLGIESEALALFIGMLLAGRY